MFRCLLGSFCFDWEHLNCAMDVPALGPLLLLVLLSGSTVCQEHILPEGPVEALVGSSVTLNTLLSKPMFTFILWNFNDGEEQFHISTLGPQGLNTNAPYAGRVNISEDGYLTLTGLKVTDSGEYSISIVSATGATKTSEIELRVIEPVSNVLVKSDVPDAIELITTVVLTCTAKGSFLKFSWLNGTTAIVPDGKHITVTQTESSSTLTVASVYRTDLAGPLFCSASNSLSSGKSPAFNLTVYYGPDEVGISLAPEFVASKSDFNLSCKALSNPPASFSWFQGNTSLEVTGAVLSLNDIEKKGLGQIKAPYSCKASNDKTKKALSSIAVFFTVIEPLSDVKLTAPSELLFAGNSSANLNCAAAKGTVDAVAWLKDGVPLTSTDRMVIAEDKRSVQISPLEKEDNGEYMCTLSNPVSSQTAKATLSVIYGPEPVVLTGESEVEVNDLLKLDCSALSVPPANYTWKFNGTKTPVTTSHYVINHAAFSNSGTYTCEAYNALTGKISSNTHVLVVRGEGELDEGLSDGAIAGIVIGVLAAVALAIGLFIYCRQKVPVESPY